MKEYLREYFLYDKNNKVFLRKPNFVEDFPKVKNIEFAIRFTDNTFAKVYKLDNRLNDYDIVACNVTYEFKDI
jgi:hypothetical protein